MLGGGVLKPDNIMQVVEVGKQRTISSPTLKAVVAQLIERFPSK